MDTLGCACPKCGWEDSEVRKTTKVTGGTIRARLCKQCGTVYPTLEVVMDPGEVKKNSARGVP